LLADGTILAGYRIDGTLGKGGMGVVYEATQLSLNRKVALKVLAPHLSDDVGFRKRFRREGEIQARMDHPHIIPVYEAGETEHGLFIAMRVVRGPNLKRMVVMGELEPERVIRLLSPIAEALDAAHDEGLIHRDIKPQNILVTRQDHPYLADFGLTKGVGESTLTRTGQFVGTLHYVSPEQIQGEAVGPPSDVYALAAVLYECLTRAVPFPKDSEAALIYAHLSDPPPRVTDLCPELPYELDEVVARGMAKDPEHRHRRAAEMLSDARDALAGGAPNAYVAPAATTVSSPTSPAPGRRRVRPPVWLVGAAVLTVAALAGLLVGRAGEPEQQAGTSLASSNTLELSSPSSWRRPEVAPRLPGIEFKDPIALAPPGARRGDGLIAGQVAATGQRLLPPTFLRRLRQPLGQGDAVQLDKLEAYRYSYLDLERSDKQTTLFVVPNSGGVATMACVDSTTAGDLLARCERIANSLTLVKDDAYPLGPDRDYAESLTKTIDSLNDARVEGRRKLRAARTPASQAVIAAALSGIHENAYQSLSRGSVGPADRPVNEALADAVRHAASAYADLSDAAGAGRRADYEIAARRVHDGERAFRLALDRLARRGYQVE
jgi:serine/threonine protein kinase